MGSDFFGQSIFYHPDQIYIIEAEFSLPLLVKLLPTILSVLGALLAFYLYSIKSGYLFITNLFYVSPVVSHKGKGKGGLMISSIIKNLYSFLNGKYLLDIIYNNYIISGGLKLGHVIFKLLDKGIIELVGPFGLSEGSYNTSYLISRLDTGVITTYALYITLGLISLLFILT
jgi:NADH-ubiquinone oxidoreductase chain 5